MKDSICPMSIGISKNSAVTSAAWTRAPAKINLTLDVLGRRPDGFHNLRSLVIGVDLRDRVRCALQPKSEITMFCSDSDLDGARNLAVKAATKLARWAGCQAGLRIELEKIIPTSAGLGGGSSDAAATLRLCNELWATKLGSAELAALGARVGSDVPLFFALPGALMTGRGEEVKPVKLSWSGWVLLVFAGCAVSTREVYRSWRPADGAGLLTGDEASVLEAGSAEELAPLLRNHLEPAVFRVSPVVARAYEALKGLGFAMVRVSGAGSALYVLFDERQPAIEAGETIDKQGDGLKCMVVAAPARESSIYHEEQ